MEFDIFTLCDFAQDVDGKLTIVGTFDTIFASGFPTIHPMCSIATRIRFPNNEAGQHSFTLSILDSRGKAIITNLSGNINVKIPNGMEWGTAHIVIGIGQLTFHSYGKYSINLTFDNKQIKSLTFVVKKTSKEA